MRRPYFNVCADYVPILVSKMIFPERLEGVGRVMTGVVPVDDH